MTWADVNGDGNEDLLIASGAGGETGSFLGDGKGGFTPWRVTATDRTTRDQTTILAPGGKTLLIGLSNFEDGEATGTAVEGAEGIPANGSATGPLAMADVDGDGQLDLFVGGRSVPGQYPAPASSRLFLRKGGGWVVDEKAGALLKEVGLVSGATFTDLNGDGAPDLVLALEWGPLKVFLNDGHGAFRDATAELGLDGLRGWWTGVAAGDFDGDGRMDLVATNWGLNSKYEHHYDATHPLRISWGDFNGDGITQVIESHFDHAMNKLVPERGLSCSSTAMPFIKKLTPTYQLFGGSGLEDIYGARLQAAPTLTATHLEHLVLLNRGGRFEARPLPMEAQLAPSLGVAVADFDGDGKEDLLLSQNFFAAQIETPRIDAGRGLLLLGDGKGGFRPLPAWESGVRVYGDGRGVAVADYDHDGRPDVVMAQNGSSTRLLHNQRATPGLRVRLSGTEGNPGALGAQMALLEGRKRGPVRELHGGGGYWSQDSAVTVLATTGHPDKLWVRWPGGRETTTPLPAGAKEVTVQTDGALSAPEPASVAAAPGR